MRPILKIIMVLMLSAQLEAHSHCHHHDHETAEEFHWTREKIDMAGIAIQEAGPGVIRQFAYVAGKVIFHPDHLAYITPKINGSVWNVWKNLGDPIDQGEILAIMESVELAEAKAGYLTTLKKFHMQQQLLQKEEKLRGISPEVDYLNAQFAAEEAALQLQLCMQRLYALGLNEQEIAEIEHENPQSRRLYAIRSPIKGKVMQRNLTLGEQIDPQAKIFTIGDFETIWVEMHIAQNDVHRLKAEQIVEVVATGGKKALATVCQFNPSICEETRTATAIASISNDDDEWTPGEFVTARIQTEAHSVPIAVPKEAIQEIKGLPVLFVDNGEEFVPCVVRIGKMDAEYVEIVGGLEPGTCYAASNTFCLKADLQKEEAEHHH